MTAEELKEKITEEVVFWYYDSENHIEPRDIVYKLEKILREV